MGCNGEKGEGEKGEGGEGRGGGILPVVVVIRSCFFVSEWQIY